MQILFAHVAAAPIITSQEQEALLLRQLRLFQRCSLQCPPWLLKDTHQADSLALLVPSL